MMECAERCIMWITPDVMRGLRIDTILAYRVGDDTSPYSKKRAVLPNGSFKLLTFTTTNL